MKQEQKSIATLLKEHLDKVGEAEFKKEWEQVEKQCEGMPEVPIEALFLPCASVSLRDFFAAEAMKAECISWNAELSNEYRAIILEDMIERWQMKANVSCKI